MMTNKEIYKAWAPYGMKWVDWVRPTPFVAIDSKKTKYQPINLFPPYLSQLKGNDKTTAVIIDLPGQQSVEVGLQLLKQGFRPIPIYNGVMEQKNARATSDNDAILDALAWGASVVKNTEIDNDAPPAFLTDTNRLQRYKLSCSIFDNSWDVYHQDLPSEDYFIQNGITNILVVSEKLSRDLRVIFKNYPKKKVRIYLTDGYEEPRCIRKGR